MVGVPVLLTSLACGLVPPLPDLRISRRVVVSHASTAALTGLAVPAAFADDSGLSTAIFSGGDPRFLQPGFDEIKYLGVKKTEVGSITTSDGTTIPALKVLYKPEKLSYQRVVGAFWRVVDPTRTAEQGQFGAPGPTIIWVSDDAQRTAAEKSAALLQKSTQFSSPTFGPMFKGLPLRTEIRPLLGSTWDSGPDSDQAWYLNEPKAFEAARKKSGRAKWFDDAFKPVTVTACQKEDPKSGNVCGFVYFPCSDENGCTAVLNGAFTVPASPVSPP
jgi:hypothetical protein